MSPKVAQSPEVYSPIQKWVDRLVSDIAARGLQAGDTYLTSDQACELLGCSRTTAYRAIKLLVERKVLVSKPGSGSFIGPEAPIHHCEATKSIHVLMPLGFEACTAMPLIQLVQGLAKSLGGWGFQFNAFPRDYNLDYIRGSLLEPQRAGLIGAVIPIGCHWTVHKYLGEEGYNALVLGSEFPDQLYLPSIDKDSTQAGEILVDHLIAKKYRNFVVMAFASGLAGVDLFTDAISRRLSHHGIPGDSLTLRYCTGDEPVTTARLRKLLEGGSEPTAIITDEEDLANLAARAVQAAGLRIGKDVEIVFSGSLFRAGSSAPYSHTCITATHEELIQSMVEIIQANKVGAPPQHESHFIPVELAEHHSTKSK